MAIHAKWEDPVGPLSCLDHVSLGVSDLARAKAFYDATLSTLGMVCTVGDGVFAWAYGKPGATPMLFINKPLDEAAPSPGNGVHVALRAPSRAAVRAFHAIAVANGGRCEGPPGLRIYHADYFAAYVRDPDGNKIEAVCHHPSTPG
jgi:catechol 2,3-dioxygenase-like lactoylglutathione lyase family enzyme